MSAEHHDPSLPEVTLSELDGVRYLHLDSIWVQGAMRINKPRVLELEYIQRMMAWMLWRPAAELTQGHAVQLGLGAAAITRFCHQVLRMRTTAVELNPAVIAACRMRFRLGADDERLTVLNQDAGAWVRDPANAQTVDVLNVDLYDHEAAAPVLDDAGFYAACHRVLNHGGLMTVNLFGRDASFLASAERIAAAFGRDQVWSLRPTREGNTVVVAARGVVVPGREELIARADNIEKRYGPLGVPARKWLRMARPLPVPAN
ncbi:spermidine synthase [uncultured Aquincola sp.]|uniref:spermine/spermidine synthase domain-containing protein n=1 Tax=uncultured Aquincola sp. TaxID=886556 RepID=UPI0032B1EC03